MPSLQPDGLLFLLAFALSVLFSVLIFFSTAFIAPGKSLVAAIAVARFGQRVAGATAALQDSIYFLFPWFSPTWCDPITYPVSFFDCLFTFEWIYCESILSQSTENFIQ